MSDQDKNKYLIEVASKPHQDIHITYEREINAQLRKFLDELLNIPLTSDSLNNARIETANAFHDKAFHVVDLMGFDQCLVNEVMKPFIGEIEPLSAKRLVRKNILEQVDYNPVRGVFDYQGERLTPWLKNNVPYVWIKGIQFNCRRLPWYLKGKPIENMVVVSVDGNPLNLRLDNLELLFRDEQRQLLFGKRNGKESD